jgi:hypothetical protein
MEGRGEGRMKTIGWFSSVTCAAVFMIAGCQSTDQQPKQTFHSVAIDSFQSVAGKWAGVMIRTPRSREEDWIRVTIQPDGRYEFASYRTIGVLSGHGQFTLADGKLAVKTERGTAMGTLWMADDRRMLRFAGVLEDGMQYTAEVTPAK